MAHQQPEQEIVSTDQQQPVVHRSGGFEITIKPTTEPTSKPDQDATLKPINGHSNNNPSENQDPNIKIETTLGMGIQRCFTTASDLRNFLPTGTNLIFGSFLPTMCKSGQCSSLSTTTMIIVLGLCASFCFLSSFTDSFERSDNGGKKAISYGFVTTKGLWLHNHKGFIEDERYKLGFGDVLHAMMSLVVFLAIAFSDHRVIDCLFPKHVNDVEQVMHVLVLVVGFVCSFLFLLFPVYRRGFVPTLPKNCSSSH